MKFDLLKALAKGVINLAKLDETGDEFALAIVTKKKSWVVPVVKSIAYLDDEELGEDYSTIQEIIDAINLNKLYKEVSRFGIKTKAAPEHSKIVYGFAKSAIEGAPSIQPEGLDGVFKAAGYSVLEHTVETAFVPRDYSEIMKKPEYKKIYDENHALLEKTGANYKGLNKETQLAYESVEAGKMQGLIFTGPTGTGKSWTAMILADHAGAPLLNLQVTYGTTVEDLVGSFIPNDGAVDDGIGAKLHAIMKDSTLKVDEQIAACEELIKSSGNSSKWKFIPGPLLRAKYEGLPLVLEEVNYGQAGIISKINEFTDDTPRVTVNGITYEAHRNFVLYMTMNPGYAGTDPLNVALKNRFAIVDVPALTKAEFAARAQKYSAALGHKLRLEFFNKLFDFAAFLEKEGNSNAWHEDVKFSIRNANRLSDSILIKKRNFAEFQAAVAVNYINNLSTDNDNSAKLAEFKKDKTIVDQIQQIYELYDFAEAKTVAKADSLDAFFSEEEETSGDDASERSEAMKKITERFGMR